MENCIMIDGVKIPLTDDQVKMMRSAPSKPSPFERVEGTDKKYFWIDSLGGLVHSTDWGLSNDVARCKNANYCTDKDLMFQRALHETLNRLLWRFSLENGEDENEWDENNRHYYLLKLPNTGKITIAGTSIYKIENTIYFPSREIAFQAIEKIVKPFMEAHSDFVWQSFVSWKILNSESR